MDRSMTYHTIGLMSGTSMDGLDIAHSVFTYIDGSWSFKIKEATTIQYPHALLNKLVNSIYVSESDLKDLDIDLGKWIGSNTKEFIKKHNLNIDLVASHGHTVFHQPENRLTLQIGDGQEIYKACRITVVNDFRSKDVSLGGNGAPLVPIGDKLLFEQYEACLNLGGIANISFDKNKERIAFDISPANMVLNKLAQELDELYDNKGKMASTGNIDSELLNNLNMLLFYKRSPPKSLGYEWVEGAVFQLLKNSTITIQDKLSTAVEHIAIQISSHLPNGNTLITGGGVYNTFLIDRLKSHINKECSLIIPEETLIEYKEAMVFGFLGVLRVRDEVNCMKSVTGASCDNTGGVIYRK